MTNSTDDSQNIEKKIPNEKEDKKAKKANKKKGPIRTEAVIPVVIIAILSGVYFYLFFDSHLRKGIELGATYGHGAEVNIGELKTSFLNGSFSVLNIQVTDKEKPSQNLIQIGKIHFQASWDALLRAKFLVEDAAIENIQAYVPRKSPGRILPVDKSSNKVLSKVHGKALEQAKEEFNENILGDVASVLDGADPDAQIKKMQADLKSEKRIKEIETELKAKEKLWKERFAKLPQKKQVDILIARARNLKFKGNALQIAEDLKKADAIIREADQIYKSYDSAQKDLKSDYNSVEGSINNIDQLIKNDIQDLQTRLKIPNINVQDFSKGLFGKMFQGKLATIQKYADMGKKYMPPPQKGEAKPEVKAPPRGKGKNIKFPITTGYPLFWLKTATISSEPSNSEYSGRIRGILKNATSDPKYLKIPTTIEIQGDFPNQGIKGLMANIKLDHTKEISHDTLAMTIQSFPVDGMVLSNSDDVKFSFAKAEGATRLNAEMVGDKTDINLINYFQKIDYKVQAKSQVFDEILKGVVADIPKVQVQAKAKGPWSGLSWNIRSNLGQKLSQGFKKQINAKIDQAKAKLRRFVDDRIKAERDKLTGQFDQSKKKFTGQIDKHKKEIDNAKNQIQSGQKKASNQKKNEVKKAADKAVKDLKKKFKLNW